jgi:hypothetical protein
MRGFYLKHIATATSQIIGHVIDTTAEALEDAILRARFVQLNLRILFFPVALYNC